MTPIWKYLTPHQEYDKEDMRAQVYLFIFFRLWSAYLHLCTVHLSISYDITNESTNRRQISYSFRGQYSDVDDIVGIRMFLKLQIQHTQFRGSRNKTR